jgi:hypothetical protein
MVSNNDGMNLLRKRMARYDLPQRIKEKGVYPYFRSIESRQDTEVIMNGRHVLMFGSNSYLGLTNHPRVIEAAAEATRKYGTGCAGSRFLNGTIDLHLQLERELAAWVGKEDAMVYSTGFQVNLGVVSCVTGRDDYVICDEFDHASIVEGRRLSFSTPRKYRHADMASLAKAHPAEGKILTYILDSSPEKTHVVDFMKRITGYDSYDSSVHPYVNDRPVGERVVPALEQWLAAFVDAEFVVTDSFHGCVLSLLLHKRFIAVGNSRRGMARLNSLLDMFGLDMRLVHGIDPEDDGVYFLSDIDWEEVDRIIARKREESLTFLRESLEK